MGRIASIDVGTNSVLLTIAEARTQAGSGTRLRAVVERCTITRLGQGVDRTRRLDEDAVARTLACLETYRAVLDREGVEQLEAVGTSALRDARASSEFLERAARVLGTPVRVISGEDEASLTFEGALSGLSVRGDVLVFDIGGGSTEVISGQARATARIDSLASLDIGSVRLTERHVTSDPLNSADIVAVRRSAREAFATLPVPPPTATLIGVGGTVTTLYAASIGLATYDSKCVHGATLTELTLAELTSRLTTLTASERCEIKGIEPGRADVMPAGAILTSEALRWGHGAEMVVSDRGLRWGLLERLLAP